ncbi:alpha/beta hydrolase [Nocardia bovistercoris]|uniref:Alpha/beta hydrolase n=1 Tax=Nocardia bovistercoris TaxID=2785916 RepID=A0A931I8L1_9NOCA|nr:alpha/beta hydrolase [Nocardia bovistercoris]MBH0775860.1 alpha/beta hydrolase [Nocardia bovistercoris]
MRDIDLPLPVVRAALAPVFRTVLNHRLSWRAQRLLLDVTSRVQLAPGGTIVHRLRLAGRPAERVTAAVEGRPVWSPSTTGAAGAVLYLHGGGFTVGSPRSHRSLTARLARDVGCAVYVLDYRLAPEHPFPAALDDAESAFLALTGEFGYRPERIAIAGDSAGGGLALAAAQRLVAEHGHTPAALGLIAPWVDPNIPATRPRDLVISGPWSRSCAAAYLGGGDGDDPGYAPLRGALHGLPPTYVQADADELLHEQGVELVAALRAAGVHVRFSETKGLWHVAQLQASLVGPAAAALREMADFLREAVQPVSIRDLG